MKGGNRDSRKQIGLDQNSLQQLLAPVKYSTRNKCARGYAVQSFGETTFGETTFFWVAYVFPILNQEELFVLERSQCGDLLTLAISARRNAHVRDSRIKYHFLHRTIRAGVAFCSQ